MHWSELSQHHYYLLLALVLLSFGLLVLQVNKRNKRNFSITWILSSCELIRTELTFVFLYFLATLIGGHASLRQAPETPDPFAQEV